MWHHLIWILVLWLLSGIITANQVPQRASEVALIGTNVTLVCNISSVDLTVWMFDNKDQLSQGQTVFTPSQYALDVRNDRTQMALTVITAEDDDEGLYSCQDQGNPVMEYDLTIEVQPTLQLEFGESIHSTNGTVDVTFTEEAGVQCIARGSKPLVSLRWEVDGRDAVGVVTTNNSREDERITVSTLQYIPNVGDKTLTCITGGQQVVPSETVTANINVMYAPKCSLLISNETTNEFRLFCRCEANPPPNNYGIYVNNSLQSTEKEVFISSQSPAVVFCNASNIIGADTTDPVELGEFHVGQPISGGIIALIVCVLILLILMIALVIVILQRRKVKKHQDSHGRTQDTIAAHVIPLPPPVGQQQENTEGKGDPSKEHLMDPSSQRDVPSEQDKENTEGKGNPSKEDVPSEQDKDLTNPGEGTPLMAIPTEQNEEQLQDMTNPGEGPGMDKEKWKEEDGEDDDEDI